MIIDNKLMVLWEPKVQKIASNTFVRGLDREDIAQELRIALIKAAKGFEEDRGVLFHTYLHTAMINTVRTLIAKAQRQIATESLEGTPYMDSEGDNQRPAKIARALASPHEFTQEVELMELLAIAKLSPLERHFVDLRLEGLTMEEITEDLGESAYKIRLGVQEKLGGILNHGEEKTDSGGFDS